MPRISNEEKDIEKREIGDNLRMKREAAGMSQSQLAIRLGVERNVVHRYETSENEMKLTTAAKIASILHTSVEDLIPAKYRKEEMAERRASQMTESIDPRMSQLLEQIKALPVESLDMFYAMTGVTIKGLSGDCKTA